MLFLVKFKIVLRIRIQGRDGVWIVGSGYDWVAIMNGLGLNVYLMCTVVVSILARVKIKIPLRVKN
jgi:hypothetical protein